MSSISITGKPGGGKSLWAMEMLLSHFGEKNADGSYRNLIVHTNIPLKLEGIHAYVEKHQPEWYEAHNLDDFLIEMPDSCVPEYWRYRSRSLTLPNITADEYKKDGVRPEWKLSNGVSCAYYLDELHKFLNARNWQRTGPLIIDHITQHRHLGDEVRWMSPLLKMVDSQYRETSEEFHYVRNRGRERGKYFRNHKDHKVSIYAEPTRNDSSLLREETFRFKKEIGECYHTSQFGTDADTKKKIGGIPLWVGITLGIILIISGGVLLNVLPGLATRSLVGAGVEDAQVVTESNRSVLGEGEGKAPSGERNSPPPAEERRRASGDAGWSAEGVITTPTERSVRDHTVSRVVRSVGRASDWIGGEAEGESDPYGVGVRMTPTRLEDAVVLTGSKEEVANATALLSAIQPTQKSPVRLRAFIGTIRQGGGREWGVEWLYDHANGEALDILHTASLESSGAGLVAKAGYGAFDVAVRAAISSEAFTVHSRPVITGRLGTPMEFTSGREIPVTELVRDSNSTVTSTQFKEALFRLSVTVFQVDGRYLVDITQSNSDVLEASEGQVPPISSQTLLTSVEVLPGSPILLGGVATETTATSKTGVPILSSIPLLGRAFSAEAEVKERVEFVIIMAVEEVSSSEASPRVELEWTQPPVTAPAIRPKLRSNSGKRFRPPNRR